jgi:two-component system, NtrC family, response regulator HydG
VQESRAVPKIVISADLGDLVGNVMVAEGGDTPVVFFDATLQPAVLPCSEEAGILVISEASGLVDDPSFWRHVAVQKMRLPVIVVTKRPDVTATVRLMRAGAHDVVSASAGPEHLEASIRAALAEACALEAVGDPGERLEHTSGLVGVSPAMCAVRRTIASVAPSDASVFIVGESGTGKELVARALHLCSRRSARPFLAINCAALPRDILENELFGHERGAFTGALMQKAGCFELANGGTLFLDEIGEMTSETQAKLLRVIEQQAFRRLGGKQEIHVDVRVIAATNRDVERSLEEGLLRPDLYYRLSVVEMVLPPLRSRGEDIPLLIGHFIRLFAEKYGKRVDGVRPACLEIMQGYEWPGNVRELRNAIERAVVICPAGDIDTMNLPEKIQHSRRLASHIRIPIGMSVEEAEKKLILETLLSVDNNKAKAARILGVSRKTLHNKLNAFAHADLASGDQSPA